MSDIGEHFASVEHAIAVLNRVHEADPTVLAALVGHRVTCNDTLADDPTVQVSPDSPARVGLLGVLNGIFGCRGVRGPICVHYDDDGAVTGFGRTPL